MELFVLLVLLLIAIVALTHVGALFISIGVVAVMFGVLPWWVLVLLGAAVFLWPESARERQERAARIEADYWIEGGNG